MGIKYKVDENFFNSWNNDMAYVLGFFYADGSMENASYLRGKYIRFYNTEITIIKNIKKLLHSEHKIKLLAGDIYRKKSYLLRIGSHKLYDSLVKFGLYPNKSLTIKLPQIPQKYFGDFVRGYFDGDGCIYLEFGRGKKKQKIIKKLTTIFTSGSKVFLEELRGRINKACQINRNSVYNSHRSFQLRYNTQESLKIFDLIYHDKSSRLYLKRKRDIFEKYLKIKNGRMVK